MIADAYYIEFWDHAMVSGEKAEPARCEVWGIITQTTPRHYRVVSWLTDKTLDENTEGFVILRKAVIRKVKLLPPKLRATRRSKNAEKKRR